MFSIPNRALSGAITSFGNKFCLKKRSRLIKALNNRFYAKFMELEIGLLVSQTLRTMFSGTAVRRKIRFAMDYYHNNQLTLRWHKRLYGIKLNHRD